MPPRNVKIPTTNETAVSPTGELPPQGSLGSGGPLGVRDALAFLDLIKERYKPKVYNRFLSIMKEFKEEIIDTRSVMGQAARLFRAHADVLEKFNTFLPSGYRIDVSAWPELTGITPTGTIDL